MPQTVLGDAQDTGLPSSSFEFVYNIGVLEHFEDPTPLLVEGVRILRPGGLAFFVIVPELSRLMGWPQRALLNPIKLARLVAASVVKGKYREKSAQTVRTSYSRQFYEDAAASAAATMASCFPYNPYVPVYSSGLLENSITVPLYRAHYGLKRNRSSRVPALRTAQHLAMCDLLVFRAP